MSSRSNWEARTQPSATERLKAALSRPVNEAIKVEAKTEKPPVDTPSKLNSAVLGTGAAARAARAMKKGTTGQVE